MKTPQEECKCWLTDETGMPVVDNQGRCRHGHKVTYSKVTPQSPSQNWEDSNKNWRVEVRRLISRCHASVYEDEMKKSQAEMLEHIDNLLTSREELLKQRCLEIEDKYQELIMAVENKYDGRSRHETALMYIKNAESSNEEAVTRVYDGE